MINTVQSNSELVTARLKVTFSSWAWKQRGPVDFVELYYNTVSLDLGWGWGSYKSVLSNTFGMNPEAVMKATLNKCHRFPTDALR